MNWDANLAAIIKHTDANLKQQFRQFDDLPLPSGAFAQPPPAAPSRVFQREPHEEAATGIASTFLRETMATMRGEQPSTSFAQHFQDLRERKRHDQRENNRAPSEDGESEYEDGADQQDYRYTSRRRRSRHRSGLGHQVYTSPTYDVAQMMEQVRLSLKLEVDARAAIGERQLSALMQLCKALSEELDRLRIEVCAADRQLHTIDQVQAKMRQELTTQKDIGYHLQSMCGKDESWRVQAENQLLELRQLVAALREHGNSVQMQVQEKLSRQELLVQFNAAIEPIKAQFQATLQHQAHQLAEVTRTSSSTTLLLDALTQKVNRVQADELVALRSDLQALKALVHRMGILDGRGAVAHETETDDEETHDSEDVSKARKRRSRQRESREKERGSAPIDQSLQLDALKKEIVEVMLPQAVKQLVHSELEMCLRPHVVDMKEYSANQVAPLKLECRQFQETLASHQRHTAELETQLKQLEQQLRGDLAAQSRELRERTEQVGSSITGQLPGLVDSRVASVQSKLGELQKSMDMEQKERKLAMESVHEDLRKTRHALEEQVHTMACEQRTKISAMGEDCTQKLRDCERKWSDTLESSSSKARQQVDVAMSKADTRIERVEMEMKAIQTVVVKMERAMEQSQSVVAQTAAKVKGLEASSEEEEPRLARRGSASTGVDVAQSVQLASIDMMLQKMMLQMQLQYQQQQQQQSHIVMHQPPQWTPPPPVAPTPAVVATPTVIAAQVASDTVVRVEKEGEKSGQAGPTINQPVVSGTVKAPTPAIEPTASEPIKPALPGPAIDSIIARAVAEELATSQRPQPSATEANTPPPQPTSIVNDGAAISQPGKAAPLVPVAKSQPPPPAIEIPDSSTRVPQQTLETTVKGAVTEAEMAKMRIEARRKSEQEARQQGTLSGVSPKASSSAPPPPPSLTRSASTTSLTPTAASPTVPVSPLTRSSSVSNLTPTSSVSVAPPSAAAPSRPPPAVNAPPAGPTSTPSKPPPPPPSVPAVKPPTSVDGKSPTSSPPTLSRTPSSTSVVPEAKPPTSKPPPPPSTPSAPPATSPPTATPAPVVCEQCRLPVRGDLLSDHMQRQCIKRTVGCSKCQVKFSWHEVDNHQRDCTGPPPSSSTSPPPVPSPSVTVPSDSTDASALKKCRHCSADVPGSELFEHELRCDQMLKQCPHCLRRQRVAELQDHIENCDCRLVSCPNDCGGKFLQRGIDKHLATRCPKRSTTDSTTRAAPPTPSPPSTTLSAPPPDTASDKQPPADKVECKFCDEEFTALDIETHENNCDWKPKRCQHCSMVIIARDLLRHESSCKTTTKNCPHCNDTMPPSALPLHPSRCAKRPIKCIRCCQMFPADSIVAHSSSCKFVPSTVSASASPAAAGGSVNRVPPPPPTPPPSVVTATTSRPPTPATSQVSKTVAATTTPAATAQEDERIARRNLALSQLTNPTGAPQGGGPRASAAVKKDEEEDHNIDDDEDEEEEEEDEEEDEDQLTLAQVVAEWSVENVCLWLHEDVGVPEVVPRFQQRRCNGEALLELTESDLINDYGIKNRVHRERILSAIDAIKTSDDFSDEDLEDEEDDDDEEEEEPVQSAAPWRASAAVLQVPQQRAPMSRLTLSDASTPQTLLRRNSLPSPQASPGRGLPPSANAPLPSSNSMLRRINSALNVEFPPTSSARK